MLGLFDYVENDLGTYHEVAVSVLVRPAGSAPEETGAFIHRLPVDQPFTCEAGQRIWGFPKTIESIEFDYSSGRQW